ncbi:suppressor of cytokine signaling 1b isoform X1 [Synchiropus splendidus]|uniref:suppressor of cytokine signaling 1b isoform X1 n=1 Tax=Synchiropus splendidus TaxID=270530 RepID=UPI00237DCC1F|nr:suppressor of cytokine signaling 1b isoform X1 [Synchiropus splendidus]XP_053709055.1 suppressor of cytokine signaling 1b isoform X1 [Synchiropus splendidus]
MVKHNQDRNASPDPEGPNSAPTQSPEAGPLDQLLLRLEEELQCGTQQTDGESLPCHFRPFASREEYELVRLTHRQLQHSGFYWGATSMADAHHALAQAPVGTFLIRDSSQPDVFFTLSYQSEQAPTSVRVLIECLRFRLSGSAKSFPSMFALLAHYTSGSCKLTRPHRRERPERLKQLCRRALVKTHGAGALRTFAGLSAELRDYVGAYPHAI